LERLTTENEATELESSAGGPLAGGYITDFISGQPVRATPEETEAVQVFARRLVEDRPPGRKVELLDWLGPEAAPVSRRKEK
jgi:hypothetical protein